MRTLIAIAVGTLALSFAAPAASQEYRRGYYDCLAGRYDEEQHGEAYRRGCRAAEREREADRECPPGEDCGGMGERRRYGHEDMEQPAPYLHEGMGEPPPYPHEGMGEPPPYGGEGMGGPRPYPRQAGLPNVTGMGSAQAMAAMAAHGYRSVGAAGAGAAIVGIYYNRATGECVQLAYSNGRVAGVQPMASDPRCR